MIAMNVFARSIVALAAASSNAGLYINSTSTVTSTSTSVEVSFALPSSIGSNHPTNFTFPPTSTSLPSSPPNNASSPPEASGFAQIINTNGSALASGLSNFSSFSNSTPVTGVAASPTRNGTEFIALMTSAPFLNRSQPFANITVPGNTTVDLSNATQCWPALWSYSSSETAWYSSNFITTTLTSIFLTTRSMTTTTVLVGNYSQQIQCDGLPRFSSDAERSAIQTVIMSLPTPIVEPTTSYTVSYIIPIQTTTPSPRPTCSINSPEECTNVWKLFASSLTSSLDSWSTDNVLTMSLAAPPTQIVINGRATPLTAAPGAFPTLTVKGDEYTDSLGTYHFGPALNLYGETYLAPGEQRVLTWNYQAQTRRPFGPNCPRPSSTIVESLCATAECTISARSFELMYFAPPSTSRDICANTLPGYDSYSVSIYSQPHASTVINGSTFWSDKAYIRYHTMTAEKLCWFDNMISRKRFPVGSTYYGDVIEVASSDISSLCGIYKDPLIVAATARPYNFDDLNGPIPASAYLCNEYCFVGDFCSAVVSTRHRPRLAVPPQVKSLDPEWSSCRIVFDGVVDPPIALGTAKLPVIPTTRPGPTSTIPPSPGSSGEPIVTPTNTPSPTPTVDPPIRPPTSTTDVPWESTITLPTAPTPPPPPPPESSLPSNPNSPINPPNTPAVSSDNPQPNRPSQPGSPPLPNNPGQSNNNNPINAPSGTPFTTIGSSIVNFDPSRPGTIVVNDPASTGVPETLSIGGSSVVIAGTTLSLSPSTGALVLSGTSSLNPIGEVGGQTIWEDPSRPGIVLVGDPSRPLQTLSVNSGSVVIDGTTISLAPQPTGVSIPITIAGIPFTVLPDGTLMAAGSQIIRSGDPAVTIEGRSIFFNFANSTLVIDGMPYPAPSAANPSVTIHNIPMQLQPDGSVFIEGIGMLRPGEPQIIYDGHTIIVLPNGGGVLVDGTPVIFPTSTTTPSALLIVGPDGVTTTVRLGTTERTALPQLGSSTGTVEVVASLTGSGVKSSGKTTKTTTTSRTVTGSTTGNENANTNAVATSSKKGEAGNGRGGVEYLGAVVGVGIAILMVV